MENAYSSMATFIGKNLIKNKLKYSTVRTNQNYAPYAEEALAYLAERHYTIVDDACVPI